MWGGICKTDEHRRGDKITGGYGEHVGGGGGFVGGVVDIALISLVSLIFDDCVDAPSFVHAFLL